ncbi:uncharacterized protein SAPINGB_P004135 [Magnusiomyces paraingens]|uniref:DASH complex subunit ASK1 n=1 Tax=Magnusiomyces paraingens TaxID=2606893 RepID=A0A5E8BYC7_9ASCO|nr:uncharacterized protein SAPINGB_P004135 [Saprochaete ingens]VVT54557.1 unnamed protein product [Saprochaete ingens]
MARNFQEGNFEIKPSGIPTFTRRPMAQQQQPQPQPQPQIQQDSRPALLEELERTQQSITQALRQIDQNFFTAQQIVHTRIIPQIESCGRECAAVKASLYMWKTFFEASAYVNLDTYEQDVAGEVDIQDFSEQEPEYDESEHHSILSSSIDPDNPFVSPGTNKKFQRQLASLELERPPQTPVKLTTTQAHNNDVASTESSPFNSRIEEQETVIRSTPFSRNILPDTDGFPRSVLRHQLLDKNVMVVATPRSKTRGNISAATPIVRTPGLRKIESPTKKQTQQQQLLASSPPPKYSIEYLEQKYGTPSECDIQPPVMLSNLDISDSPTHKPTRKSTPSSGSKSWQPYMTPRKNAVSPPSPDMLPPVLLSARKQNSQQEIEQNQHEQEQKHSQETTHASSPTTNDPPRTPTSHRTLFPLLPDSASSNEEPPEMTSQFAFEQGIGGGGRLVRTPAKDAAKALVNAAMQAASGDDGHPLDLDHHNLHNHHHEISSGFGSDEDEANSFEFPARDIGGDSDSDSDSDSDGDSDSDSSKSSGFTND